MSGCTQIGFLLISSLTGAVGRLADGYILFPSIEDSCLRWRAFEIIFRVRSKKTTIKLMASTSKVTRLNIKMYFDILAGCRSFMAAEIVKWVYSNLYPHSRTGPGASFFNPASTANNNNQIIGLHFRQQRY